MTEREEAVLGAIIDYYLATGDSVGSRTIVKKYALDFSSATIRNVMADLEDTEYIAKTHSSSGRIPTKKGYQYYIETLLKIRRLSLEEMHNINLAYGKKLGELEEVLERTSELLSKLSTYAGIVVEPDIKTEKLKKIELVHVSNYLILAVLISENGTVRTKKIHLDHVITEEETKHLSTKLNNKINQYKGKDIVNKLREDCIEKREKIVDEIAEECFKDVEGDLFIAGAPSILEQMEEQREKVSSVLKVFDKKTELKNAFEEFVKNNNFDSGKVNVVLGEDLNIEGLENFSFIFSTYNIGKSKGIIGVIGPKRMEYSKTIGLVDYITGEVNKAILKIEKPDDS